MCFGTRQSAANGRAVARRVPNAADQGHPPGAPPHPGGICMRCRIPLGTLGDWEQDRSEPDAPARAYLKVIATEPHGTAAALAG